MKPFFTTIFLIPLFIASTFTVSFGQTTDWNWTRDDTNNPILECGPSGAWDELYVQHSSVVFDGSMYHMWYCAKSAITDNWAIGHATSPDEISWVKDTLNPVLTGGPFGSWDYDEVVNPSVLYDGSNFHMWYTGGHNGWYYKIGYAWSSDAVTWLKYNDTTTTNILYANSDPVLTVGSAGWDENIVEAPFVILEANSYIMWYRGANNSLASGIGRATSSDGINWMKDSKNNPVLTPGSASTWEKGFLRLGSVVFDNTTYHLFYYAGDLYMDFRIGYASSQDGINWTKYNDTTTIGTQFAQSDPILTWGPIGSWEDTQVMGASVILDTQTSPPIFKMWYTGADNINTPGVVSAIGYAFAPVPVSGLYEKSEKVLTGYSLSQNFPNPFNPRTNIEFQISKSDYVTLKVYNLLGQEVASLLSETLHRGSYNCTWDASGFASGLYLYQLQVGEFVETNKMILLR